MSLRQYTLTGSVSALIFPALYVRPWGLIASRLCIYDLKLVQLYTTTFYAQSVSYKRNRLLVSDREECSLGGIDGREWCCLTLCILLHPAIWVSPECLTAVFLRAST